MTPDHTTHPETDIPTEFNPSAEFSIAEGPRDVGLVFIGDSFVVTVRHGEEARA